MMKYNITYLVLAVAILGLSSCSGKYLKVYKEDMIQNPSTQAEKDKNQILQYLTDNKLDYKNTESGIYYDITEAGEDTHPGAKHIVKTHYKGYRLDGKVFDSSYDRGQPIEFPLTGVIQGWQEAIPLLGKGGKGTFLIPSGLAYGPRGAGADIPPNTVLIFDVELLDFYNPEEKVKKQAEADDALIQAFLKDKGIDAQKTDSGIYYVIKKEGTGKSATPANTVKVHYEGYLLDGTVFDSSYQRGETIEFPLNRVIPGWQESIPLLKEGGKGTFYIPSGLAYGPRGAGGVIKPNAVLAFDVELFEVK